MGISCYKSLEGESVLSRKAVKSIRRVELSVCGVDKHLFFFFFNNYHPHGKTSLLDLETASRAEIVRGERKLLCHRTILSPSPAEGGSQRLPEMLRAWRKRPQMNLKYIKKKHKIWEHHANPDTIPQSP